MTFSHPAKLGGICFFAFVLHGASSYQRVEAHRQGGPADEDDLHLQIASEMPIESAINALDCVSDAADQTLKRNTRINSQTGGAEMMDADTIRAGEAEELNKEAELHERRAQEIEDIKNQQKRRHAAAMKEIQNNDQAELEKMEHDLELFKKAESKAKADLEEQRHLMNEAEAHAPESKEMRLQQQSAKHKSKQEIAALMEYPLLGFSMPSTLNPVDYLSKLTRGTAATPTQSNALKIAANPRTMNTGASRSRPRIARSRDLQDEAEMLGDDAVLTEVVKKKGRRGRKQHVNKHNKDKPSGEKNESAPHKEATDEMDDDDDDDQSGAAKAVQKLQDAVQKPFEDPVFSESGKRSVQQRMKPKRPMRGPYKAAETDDAFAAETTVDEDDDETAEEQDKEAVSSDRATTTGSGATGAAEHTTEGHSKGRHRKCKPMKGHSHRKTSPVEATEAETAQARALQQNQSALAQQALLQRQARALPTATHGSNRIHAAITSARARFAASREKANASSEDSHDDDDEENFPQDLDQAHRSDVGPDAGAASQLEAQEAPALATDETEARAEASAAAKEAREAEASLEEENKLLAAANEANQAKNGLKTCAGGSFLNCRQESKGARPQRSAGTRVVR